MTECYFVINFFFFLSPSTLFMDMHRQFFFSFFLVRPLLFMDMHPPSSLFFSLFFWSIHFFQGHASFFFFGPSTFVHGHASTFFFSFFLFLVRPLFSWKCIFFFFWSVHFFHGHASFFFFFGCPSTFVHGHASFSFFFLLVRPLFSWTCIHFFVCPLFGLHFLVMDLLR